MRTKIEQIAKKELASYFSSPVAFIFLGVFLFVNLFIFFWVETFFARNIADVRPLFEWMPLLLIFLVAALTMKSWSEEQRMGTLELLRTLPVKSLDLVMGKFSACMALVGIALLLTVPLPVSVSFMGDLDWGPIFGGYVAAFCLAGAYVAIGLYASSRTDSQIVSLILTTLVSGAFYLLGSGVLTGFFGHRAGELLSLVGTGSRFESITRGVIDLRDLYYYVSIIGVFLSLNVLSLESSKWSEHSGSRRSVHSQWRFVTALLVLNFIAGNVWLSHVGFVRADLTQGRIYSISDATKSLLGQLREPLLIRGYFSQKTHPLLAPLVPQLRDLIREYAASGRGRVKAEFIDPRENPDLEEEASRKYNIKPVPFQIADKYQAALVNSYFDIVVQYGDKFEVLNFRDLIEVRLQGEADLDVKLRNPEYDITRSIKKILYGFQSVEALLEGLKKPVAFQAYVSETSKLPEQLQAFREEIAKALEDFKKTSGDKLTVKFDDPEAGDGKLAKEIAAKYGFRPMMAGLFDPNPFYFYLTLQDETRVVQLGFPESLDKDGAKRIIEAGLKRFSPGFLRTIGLSTPESMPAQPWMQEMGAGDKEFELLKQKLSESYLIETVDLKKGAVPDQIDLLLVVAPESFDEKQVFAVDQFLMRGGTVVLATSPYSVSRSPQQISIAENKSGLEDWLKAQGLSLEKKLILDPQNESYPVPIRRNLGGFSVEELRMVPYPFFVDVRSDGMSKESGITGGIPQVTLNWPSPVVIDKEKIRQRKHVELLRSSKESWTTEDTLIQPDFNAYPELGFAPGDKRESFVLAALVEGQTESFFKGKPSPLLKAEEKKEETPAEGEAAEEENKPVASGVIEKSAESARVILFASNEFVGDQTLGISASIGSSRYLNSLQLVENALDWSLEDRTLLSIRSRAGFARTLLPMTNTEHVFWEYSNYTAAVLGLLIVYAIYRNRRKALDIRFAEVLGG